MDNSMPKMDGLDETWTLKEELLETKVLIVSAEHFRHSHVVRCGADGYISKFAPLEEQLEAVREVLRQGNQSLPLRGLGAAQTTECSPIPDPR
jgi:DNA-binding NarL/FixJ family response regulator